MEEKVWISSFFCYGKPAFINVQLHSNKLYSLYQNLGILQRQEEIHRTRNNKKISRYRLYLFEILYIIRWNFLLLRNDFFSFLFFFYIRIDNCVIKNRNQDFPLDIFQSVHVSLEILEEKRRNKKKRYERMKGEKFTRCGIIPGRRASTESLL